MLQWEHSAILPTFIKLPFVINIFVLSIVELPYKTGFTVACLFTKQRIINVPIKISLFVCAQEQAGLRLCCSQTPKTDFLALGPILC